MSLDSIATPRILWSTFRAALSRARRGDWRGGLVWLGCRTLWLLAFVSHAVWFVQGCNAPFGSLSSLIPLALALMLFALKTIDVPFLRLRWTRRSLLAAAVIVIFVHASVITDMGPDDAELSVAWVSVEASTVLLTRKVLHGVAVVLAAIGSMSLALHMKPVWISQRQSANLALAMRRHTRLVCDSPLRAPPK